jgi:hypothetical protein
VKFLSAFKNEGEEAIKEIFDQIFSQEWKKTVPKQPIIEILSGDGKTPETAIKFSTNELQKRVRAEFWYIYYQFGKGWNHTHFTVPGKDGKSYSLWQVQLPNGKNESIYFDTNRGD